MKTVKVTYPNPELSRGSMPFPQQSPGGKGIWGDYEFVFNNDTETYDYWIVVDRIDKKESCLIPKQNSIFLTQESPSIGAYSLEFLNQFGTILTCHPDIIQNPKVTANKITSQPALAWFVNKTYDELVSYDRVPKPKLLSLITTKTNRKRYEFAIALKKHFGDTLDLFGRSINPVADKWDALADYKYSIVMENTQSPNYFSEKLADSYLAFAYPFYCGATSNLFPSGSFTRITLDPTQAISTIESVLHSPDHYTKNFQELNAARTMILLKYNFFPTLISTIRNHPHYFDEPGKNRVTVTISNVGEYKKNFKMFTKKMIRLSGVKI